MVNVLLNNDYVVIDYFEDSSGDWILVIGLFIFLLALAYPFIHVALARRKYKRESQKLESCDYELEEVVTYKVLVVDKYIDFVREGSVKYPKSRSAFFISFELENGKVRTYEVDERYFRRIKNGGKGELAVSDGKFIGFSKLK